MCLHRRLVINWRRYEETSKDRIRSASTVNDASAMYGGLEMPMMWRSLIIIKNRCLSEEIMKRSPKLLPSVHPGEMLREDFMKPPGLSFDLFAALIDRKGSHDIGYTVLC
jgi:hypothetical protein